MSAKSKVLERNSNFELLRIIAMFLIVFAHTPSKSFCAGYGLENNIAAKIFLSMVTGWPGTVGNCLFVMISSWFLVDSKFSFKNLFKIWFSVFSVSAIIAFFIWITKTPVVSFLDEPEYLASTFDEVKHLVTKKELILSFFPMYHNIYWFAGTYSLFYMAVPFLNSLVKSLNKKMHFMLAAVSFIVVFILPEFPKQAFYIPMALGLDIFFVCYFITTYIKFYEPKIFSDSKKNILAGLLIILFIFGITILFGLVNVPKRDFIRKHLTSNWICMFVSMFLFAGFKNLQEQKDSFVNKIGGATFGIYLIHGQLLFYPLVLQKIFKIGELLNSIIIIPWTIITVFIVFMVFALFELIRKEILEKPVMKLYEKIENQLLRID